MYGFQTLTVFWKVKLGCPGAVSGRGGEGAGACVPRSAVRAGAPRPPGTSPGQRAEAAAALPGRTAPPAPSRASPRVPLDTGVMDFRASETAFRRPFCLAAGPEPRFRQTSTSESRRRFKSFLCGGPKSNSCDARNKIWVNCLETCAWARGDA